MSVDRSDHVLTPQRERATLLVLCGVQFTHILDFMIMMPLGTQLMRALAITTEQFTQLVAVYAVSAAVFGFAGGFVLDRFDRKRALLTLYTGFTIATLSCALTPNFYWLLLARIAAGGCGGLSSSMVTAMVGDFIPPSRRGRAMSWVMAAFPVASVLGVPAGLVLAGHFGWHAAFYFLSACAAVNLAIASGALPHLKTAVAGHQPWRQMKEILSHKLHLRALAVGGVLVMSGGILIPFLAPTFVANVGLDEVKDLPWAYAIGGIATAFSTPLVGWMSDHFDRLHLLAVMSTAAIVVSLFITRLGASPFWLAALMMALFMVFMSSRFAPAMAMVSNAVEARYRGGFMSVNAALQQATSGFTTFLSGLFVTRRADGHFVGFPTDGYIAAGFFILTVLLAATLRAAAPHVAIPARKNPAAAASPPAEIAA